LILRFDYGLSSGIPPGHRSGAAVNRIVCTNKVQWHADLEKHFADFLDGTKRLEYLIVHRAKTNIFVSTQFV
jgi:hypothetical protein